MRDDESELNAAAERVAERLKKPVAVRAEWREQLMERIASDERGARPVHGRWAIHPAAAIAAGLFCIAVGVAGDRAMAHRAPASSVAAAATAVRFVFVAPNAGAVSVVGDFNQWTPTAAPLKRLSDGKTWIVDVPLAPGRYAYGFVVDGKLEADPNAPKADAGADDFGVANSVVLVRGS